MNRKIKNKIFDFFTYRIWANIPNCWFYDQRIFKKCFTVWYFWVFNRKFEVWKFNR